MPTHQLESCGVLQNLIQFLRNAERGFALAEEGITNGDVKMLFRHFTRQLGRHAAELETEVSTQFPHGECAATSEEWILPCAWTHIRSALNQEDEKGLIEKCGEGTDQVVKAYDSAMEVPLKKATSTLLETQLRQIRAIQEVLKVLSRMD